MRKAFVDNLLTSLIISSWGVVVYGALSIIFPNDILTGLQWFVCIMIINAVILHFVNFKGEKQ